MPIGQVRGCFFVLVKLQILVENLMPRKSLSVELLHEWIWVELLYVVNAWFDQMPLRNIIAPIIAGTPVV